MSNNSITQSILDDLESLYGPPVSPSAPPPGAPGIRSATLDTMHSEFLSGLFFDPPPLPGQARPAFNSWLLTRDLGSALPLLRPGVLANGLILPWLLAPEVAPTPSIPSSPTPAGPPNVKRGILPPGEETGYIGAIGSGDGSEEGVSDWEGEKGPEEGYWGDDDEEKAEGESDGSSKIGSDLGERVFEEEPEVAVEGEDVHERLLAEFHRENEKVLPRSEPMVRSGRVYGP